MFKHLKRATLVECESNDAAGNDLYLIAVWADDAERQSATVWCAEVFRNGGSIVRCWHPTRSKAVAWAKSEVEADIRAAVLR
jgi:hypothetical protein